MRIRDTVNPSNQGASKEVKDLGILAEVLKHKRRTRRLILPELANLAGVSVAAAERLKAGQVKTIRLSAFESSPLRATFYLMPCRHTRLRIDAARFFRFKFPGDTN